MKSVVAGLLLVSTVGLSAVAIADESMGAMKQSSMSMPKPGPESTALSKELKRRGFRFVGPTTVYALMQACGLVNDHLAGCRVRADVERAREGAR